MRHEVIVTGIITQGLNKFFRSSFFKANTIVEPCIVYQAINFIILRLDFIHGFFTSL